MCVRWEWVSAAKGKDDTMSTDKLNEIINALRDAFKQAADTKSADWYERRLAARRTLDAVDAAYSFNAFTGEFGDPDRELRPMEELDELAECYGDWAKPTYILERAFYGYRYSRDDDGRKEEFNPNDEYFTFNGYGNLVSVSDFLWDIYWAGEIDEERYVEAAEGEGLLAEVAEALGVKVDEDGEEG